MAGVGEGASGTYRLIFALAAGTMAVACLNPTALAPALALI